MREEIKDEVRLLHIIEAINNIFEFTDKVKDKRRNCLDYNSN